MKNYNYTFLTAFVFAIVAGILIGCSEDSSSTSPQEPGVLSSETPLNPETSSAIVETSSETIIQSSSDVALLNSSSSENGNNGNADLLGLFNDPATSTYVKPTNPDELIYTIDSALNVTPDADGFYYIADIYKALPQTSKVVFVIRHSEREKSEGYESLLTENGVMMAQKLGADIGNSEEEFFYASTDFIRTRETCNNIAKGRGEINNQTYTWDGINGSYFLKITSDSFDNLVGKRGGSWKIISEWAYGVEFSNPYIKRAVEADTVFYNFFERGHQFVNEVVLANLPNWSRVNFLASHDVLLEPLTVYASNRTVDLKFFSSTKEVKGKWINYLAGIAIVVNDSGKVSLYPVRGAETGWMNYNGT